MTLTVTSTKDPQARTLTFSVDFDASVERVWQVWQDPRKLERWWGPPMWPATFTHYDFSVDGGAKYHMTGPDGEKSHGWWTITAIDAPHRLEFDDGFADAQGEPTGELGATHSVITLEAAGDGTRMTLLSQFESLEQLEQMAAMGMEEGLKLALGQIEEILAE